VCGFGVSGGSSRGWMHLIGVEEVKAGLGLAGLLARLLGSTGQNT